jgi:hypothetical protein
MHEPWRAARELSFSDPYCLLPTPYCLFPAFLLCNCAARNSIRCHRLQPMPRTGTETVQLCSARSSRETLASAAVFPALDFSPPDHSAWAYLRNFSTCYSAGR